MHISTRARIFLLDSLGVEHPQPRRILAQYLLQEAHDKKHIPEGSINDPSMKQWFKEHTAGHNVKANKLYSCVKLLDNRGVPGPRAAKSLRLRCIFDPFR